MTPALCRTLPELRSPSGRSSTGGFRWTPLVLAVLAGSPLSAAAQALGTPLVPTGRLRVDFSPSFAYWDARFGIDANGKAVEEALGDDLTDPTGTSLFPGIDILRSRLRDLAPDAEVSPAVGSVRGLVQKDRSRIDLSLDLGVFDWLTVGGTVPWVRNRTTVDTWWTADPGADLGVNPALTDGEEVGRVLGLLMDAAGAARAWADGVCAGGGDCAGADALARRAEAFAGTAQLAYFASPFFPMSGSDAAGALRRALSDLDGELTGAGLGPTGAVLPFATRVMDADDFADAVTVPGAGIQGSAPLQNVEGLWELGDVEVHATVRLLEGGSVDSAGRPAGLRYYVAAGALVRLGTGKVDDPAVFLDMPSGDGQTDVEGRLFLGMQAGNRLEVRSRARYGVQRPSALLRRVAPHEVVMPPVSTLRAVEWTPGRYWSFSASPRLHLTDELSVAVDYRYYRKASDRYEILGDAEVAGVRADAADLEHESAVTAQEAAFGFTYSAIETWRADRTGTPFELHARVVRTVAGAGGRTPKATRLELGLSLFRRIWGGR